MNEKELLQATILWLCRQDRIWDHKFRTWEAAGIAVEYDPDCFDMALDLMGVPKDQDRCSREYWVNKFESITDEYSYPFIRNKIGEAELELKLFIDEIDEWVHDPDANPEYGQPIQAVGREDHIYRKTDPSEQIIIM